jgi:hypothetical protein
LGQVACFDAVSDEKFPVFEQARFIWSFMDSIEGRALLVVEMARDRFVGEEHELLDQLVGFVRRLFLNPVGSALGIEENAQFGEIQVERALCKAVATKS